ncbi:MAG: M20/M25/M40 family metallo-hydrolase [Acidimicrobiia bacterium]|nr:M20/M25/M40 family metallo-hydrolase [Acidimicrobiia bacterium]
MDRATVRSRVDDVWEREIVPALVDYIRIPNVSPAYDAGWAAAGHMDAAVELARAWCAARPIEGLTVDLTTLEGRTPLLLCEVPATPGAHPDDTVVLYGHLDKQPPMHGWRDGLGPWEPVIDDGRLYGRGGADDGYACFAALTAIEALRLGAGRHGRCVLVVECSEESGSPDLPAHLEQLGDRLGTPSLVVCLDSGCADYRRLWTTTSLRGNLIGTLRVDVLTEGVHSGTAGGVVPSSFRVLRRLLDRIEDPDTGRLLLPELQVDIPAERRRGIEAAAADLGPELVFPYAGSTRSPHEDPVDMLLAKTWEPSLSITGIDGLPPTSEAGNVLLPFTTATLSLRLPPGVDTDVAGRALTDALEADPPHGASVRFEVQDAAPGWDAPPTAPWLAGALDAASRAEFGGEAAGTMGEGGTIPFMEMLGRRFPEAQFMISGVLGPGSNAHGPNESLHLETGRRVTASVAHVLDAHAHRSTT